MRALSREILRAAYRKNQAFGEPHTIAKERGRRAVCPA